MSGEIDGSYALSKVGSGTLVLSSSTSGFTGAVSVLQGTLKLSSLNNAGSAGPLAAGNLPVVLGSNGQTGTLLYAGTTATTSENFALAADGIGNFQISGGTAVNLTLSVNQRQRRPDRDRARDVHAHRADSYTGPTTVNGRPSFSLAVPARLPRPTSP